MPLITWREKKLFYIYKNNNEANEGRWLAYKHKQSIA